MKKVELLAPAGNFDGLKGAINAGADAIYLGGQLFGARAYADNFSTEEVCKAIHMAHVFNKKVYLTVNTLVKEKELDEVYDFLLPFYEEGLDGIIIQDLGVLKYVREHFPDLELHASTQMSLSGSRGTMLMKEAGVSRIVPARELTLAEIKQIKENTGMEIEAFIHGAMCYCYSGQCLLSSILGGRSGNRGRCAQPCRLPYSVDGGKEYYPLSMRDMCTLEMIPELIEAGISSFKIEGRMKKAAYAAGVTAIYRKYIDMYYENRENYHVDEEDKKRLNSLYIRSRIGEGYYHRHNGREMLTIDSPAYSGADEHLLAETEKQYIACPMQIPVKAEIFLQADKPAKLTLKKEDFCISCEGDIVQKAVKQPLAEEKIREQIAKSGNSLLDICEVEVCMEGGVFMPVRALNELRRKAVFMAEEALIRKNGLFYENRHPLSFGGTESENTKVGSTCKICQSNTGKLHVSVSDIGQLRVAMEKPVGRIYLDYGLLSRIDEKEIRQQKKAKNTAFYLAAPYIVREKDIAVLEEMAEKIKSGLYDGVLIRNAESYQFFSDTCPDFKLVLDSNMYLWNRESLRFWKERAEEFYLPAELNRGEWNMLLQKRKDDDLLPSAVVYGRMPMMLSANCVKKTEGKCKKEPGISLLKDRYGKEFPVYSDCLCCYNIIYNSVPLSLHGLFKGQKDRIGHYRLDFTVEDGKMAGEIIDYFFALNREYKEPFYRDFTTGHFKRGVE